MMRKQRENLSLDQHSGYGLIGPELVCIADSWACVLADRVAEGGAAASHLAQYKGVFLSWEEIETQLVQSHDHSVLALKLGHESLCPRGSPCPQAQQCAQLDFKTILAQALEKKRVSGFKQLPDDDVWKG
ncbi:uncharacterized [Tachysurus ichikawai]